MAVDTRFICANGHITQRPSGTVEAVVDAVRIQQRVEVTGRLSLAGARTRGCIPAHRSPY
jgi:hypothetical protein